MNLTANVVIDDSSGSKQSGLTVVVMGHDETYSATTGITLNESSTSAGTYTASIPDTYIFKSYDIYIDGTIAEGGADISFGEWVWRVPGVTVTDDQSITYAELTDSHGDTLPTTINGASVEIVHQADRLTWLAANVDNTGFKVGVSSAGETDTATVTFIIKVV